jgi:hypothetical protein
MAWLAKVCNGTNRTEKSTQTADEITICINKKKLIKELLPEIQKVTNHVTYSTKVCQGVEKNTSTVTCTYPDSPPSSCIIYAAS